MSKGTKGRSQQTLGVAESTLRAKESSRRQAIDPTGPLTGERVREHVEVGTCPFCGRGPFVVLAIHTARAHGVDRFELRALAGLMKYESITPTDFHSRMSAVHHKIGMPSEALTALQDWRDLGIKREDSEAATKARIIRLHANRPAGSSQTPAQIERTTKAMRAAMAAKIAGRDDQIVEMVTGTNIPMNVIAQRFGVHPKTIRDTLARRGVVIDGRTRRDRTTDQPTN